MITLDDVLAARERIRGGIYESPCVESIPLSQLTGARVWCKLDYLQRTGSFKERGARNALLRLPDETKRRGVIAASAGNHAQALAWAAAAEGLPCTVVMPETAPAAEQPGRSTSDDGSGRVWIQHVTGCRPERGAIVPARGRVA